MKHHNLGASSRIDITFYCHYGSAQGRCGAKFWSLLTALPPKISSSVYNYFRFLRPKFTPLVQAYVRLKSVNLVEFALGSF